jgi:hypothetical protein
MSRVFLDHTPRLSRDDYVALARGSAHSVRDIECWEIYMRETCAELWGRAVANKWPASRAELAIALRVKAAMGL